MHNIDWVHTHLGEDIELDKHQLVCSSCTACVLLQLTLYTCQSALTYLNFTCVSMTALAI